MTKQIKSSALFCPAVDNTSRRGVIPTSRQMAQPALNFINSSHKRLSAACFDAYFLADGLAAPAAGGTERRQRQSGWF